MPRSPTVVLYPSYSVKGNGKWRALHRADEIHQMFQKKYPHFSNRDTNLDLWRWVPCIPAVNLAQEGLIMKQWKTWPYFHQSSMELWWNHDFESQSRGSVFNRPFSYSEKESQSNDTMLHLVEFSNVHNSGRSSNATRSNLVYKNV